jgi:hypothetical protein
MTRFFRAVALAACCFGLIGGGYALARGPHVVHGLHRHQHQINQSARAPTRNTPDLRGAARQKARR